MLSLVPSCFSSATACTQPSGSDGFSKVGTYTTNRVAPCSCCSSRTWLSRASSSLEDNTSASSTTNVPGGIVTGSVACAGASTPNITRHDVTNAMPIFFKRMDPPMSWTRYVRLQLKPYVEFTAFILISGGNSSANAKDHASQRCGCETL